MAVTRHPKNVPGDFYIEDGCCVSCGVIYEEAPEMFGWQDQHCFVQRQPQTEADTTRALAAMTVMEADCIRSAGSDARIRQRIIDIGEGHCLDQPLDVQPRRLDHVSFTTTGATSAREIVGVFQEQLKLRNKALPHARMTSLLNFGAGARRAGMRFSWGYGEHRVEISAVDDERRTWIAHVVAGSGMAALGAARTVHHWLIDGGYFIDIRWRTAEDWQARGADWLSTPY